MYHLTSFLRMLTLNMISNCTEFQCSQLRCKLSDVVLGEFSANNQNVFHSFTI